MMNFFKIPVTLSERTQLFLLFAITHYDTG